MSFPPLAARARLIEFFEQIAEDGEPAKMEFSPIAAGKMAEILRAVVDPQIPMSVEADEVEKAISRAVLHFADTPGDEIFSPRDVGDLLMRLENLRGQLVQARAKERLVSAQLGPYFHRAITEMDDGIWDSVDFFIDDVDPGGWDELVARARHYLGLPNVDEDEIEAAGDGGSELVTGKFVTEAGVTREQAQQRIADMLGVDPSQVTVYEGGVDLSSLERLLSALGVPAGRPATDEKPATIRKLGGLGF